MNTPAHLILGTALFGKPGQRHVPLAAALGSLLPDVSLYVMVAVSIWVMGIPAQRVFDELYFSDQWQRVFAVDNSFVLWGLVLGFGLWRKRAALTAFAAAGLLHLICDFVLHNEDARRQFWPLSNWVFRSPFSYWDPHHHGQVIGLLEVVMCLGFGMVLWRRFLLPLQRALIALVLALEIAPAIMFRMMSM